MTDRIKKHFLIWIQKPEYVYLYIALFGVLGFIFITPPFQGPDEEAHYVRTQYIANGYVVPVNVSGTNAALPFSIADVLNITFYNDDLRGRTTNTYETYRTADALHVPYDSQKTYKPGMVNYNPITYAPAVPGTFVANKLNASPIVSLYIARLSIAIASVLIVFYAIKLIPYKKYLLTVAGLTPMLLFQQSVVSADSISYSLLVLFVSYILYLRSKPLLNRSQWFKVGLLCIGVALVKPLIWVFLPLVFLLAKNKSTIKWLIGIVAITAIVFISWTHVSTFKSDPIVIAGTPSTVDGAAQQELIMEHPKRFLRVLWNSYMTSYGDDEVRGVIGVFGAADTNYPLWMYSVFIALFSVTTAISFDKASSKRMITRPWKIAIITLSTAYFGAVNLALYLGYTPVNFEIVYGVQGRYFLPILLVLAATMFIGGIQINKSDANKVKTYIAITSSFVVLLALFITYQRYYLFTP